MMTATHQYMHISKHCLIELSIQTKIIQITILLHNIKAINFQPIFSRTNFYLIECDMTLLATEVIDEKYRCINFLNTRCNLSSCVVEIKVIQPIIDIHTLKSCI